MHAPAALSPQRFHSLDALRGLAALGVVVWHWQSFFFVGGQPPQADAAGYPLFGLLAMFYRRGYVAVDLFFCLSGFVFYWLYATPIAERTLSAGRFAWLRFSRLYPLHLATLLCVALGQAAMLRSQGTYFVFPDNDLRHFLLNLGFIQSWGLERAFSFNGPAWSVSIEVLLYAAFFALARYLPQRALLLLALSAIGLFLVKPAYVPLGRGICSFFLGGCMLLAYRQALASPHLVTITRVVLWLMGSAWAITVVVSLTWPYPNLLDVGDGPVAQRLEAVVAWLLLKIGWFWPYLVVFPLTVLGLALWETRRGTLGRRLAWLGDISYASYLWHFPLQLGTVLLLGRIGDASLYASTWFFLAFFAVLILVSLASHRLFELPLQRAMRTIVPSRPVMAPAPVADTRVSA